MQNSFTEISSAPEQMEPAVMIQSQAAQPNPESPRPSRNDPITRFLIDTGKIILKNERQEWMSIDELADLAKQHGIRFQGHHPGREELETALRELFADKEEIYADGVNVVASERRQKWELLLMLRYYRYNPACSPAVLKFLASDAQLPSVANN